MTGERASEQLRQERETFEQMRLQVRRWFALRLCMGYAGLVLMVGIAGVASAVLLSPQDYGPVATGAAAAALLIDLLSLAMNIFRLVLSPGSAVTLVPVTRDGCAADHSPATHGPLSIEAGAARAIGREHAARVAERDASTRAATAPNL